MSKIQSYTILVLSILLMSFLKVHSKKIYGKKCRFQEGYGQVLYDSNSKSYQFVMMELGQFFATMDCSKCIIKGLQNKTLYLKGMLYSGIPQKIGVADSLCARIPILLAIRKGDKLYVNRILTTTNELGRFSFSVPIADSNSYIIVANDKLNGIYYPIKGFK
jgi:hypothetical protein